MKLRRLGGVAALGLALAITAGVAAQGAQTVTATVAAGNYPFTVAVNPATNKIYVANQGSNNVTVIDGATNATATVAAGDNPQAVAVNPVTDKIYVANTSSNNIMVIDGTTNATATVAAGTNPIAVAVNAATNKIYVANQGSKSVTVIDGATNATATVAAGTNPLAVAVSPATNKIYVANLGSNNVTVIDGATNATVTVAAGTHPIAVAVNPVTNKIYVANSGSNNVTVIDGATNATATIGAGTHPYDVAVNPATNKIYVANSNSNNITVIDGTTNATATIATGKFPQAVAVNRITNKIYVANGDSNNVTVIDGATNATVTVTAGIHPVAVAVNRVSNKIYLPNFRSNNVTVIDGATSATAKVAAAPAASVAGAASEGLAPPPTSVSGQVATYGDKDMVGFGYPQGADPTAGAQLTGLAPGAVSVATQIFNHSFPFKVGDNDPAGSQEYPNTDQVFVGSNQTAQHDGYSGLDGRKKGPAVFQLDYSQLVAAGQNITSLTLGIAADDFQFASFNQPFSATVNGQPDKAITDQLNKRDESGPQTYFFTVGVDPSILTPDHILTLAIDEGGDGGDGFAIDFLTIGVGTPGNSAAAAVPAVSPAASTAPLPAGVAIPAGTVITVRMTDSIDSRRDKPGKDFSASVDSDVALNGSVVIPKDSPAVVRLVNASQAGHFFGKSSLELRLVSVTVNGTSIATESGDYGLHGASRTKQTVERVGGGAALGGLLGGIMGGGKGAAIGAGVGAGAGVAVQAVTRGKSVRVPSETKLDFTLGSAAAVRATPTPSANVSSVAPPAGSANASPAATPAGPNLVTNGDFESGNTGFTSGYTYGNVADPGTYTVGPNPSQAPGAYGDWYNGGDHTTGKGNMFFANGANSASTVVWQEVVSVTPNTTYTFSLWAAQVDHSTGSIAHLEFRVNGSPVGSGDIPANSPDSGGAWQNFTFTWNSGSSSRAGLAIFDLNTDTDGNDFALDDISFTARLAP